MSAPRDATLVAAAAELIDRSGRPLGPGSSYALLRTRSSSYDAVIELPSEPRAIELRVRPEVPASVYSHRLFPDSSRRVSRADRKRSDLKAESRWIRAALCRFLAPRSALYLLVMTPAGDDTAASTSAFRVKVVPSAPTGLNDQQLQIEGAMSTLQETELNEVIAGSRLILKPRRSVLNCDRTPRLAIQKKRICVRNDRASRSMRSRAGTLSASPSCYSPSCHPRDTHNATLPAPASGACGASDASASIHGGWRCELALTAARRIYRSRRPTRHRCHRRAAGTRGREVYRSIRPLTSKCRGIAGRTAPER